MKLPLHKTWFVARYFGRGWYPETWEGWGVSFLFVLLVLASWLVSSSLKDNNIFFVLLLALTSVYLWICHIKSRKPVSIRDGKEKFWKAGKL